ncbi:MAG: hypothetical protein ACRDPA_26635, partial [Solirubrobacteraceae bacterium]
HAKAEVQSRFIAGLDGQTALTAASLRVELETAKHQAREAQRETRALKERLARALGDEVAAEHPEHGSSASTLSHLQGEIQRLLADQVQLRSRLRDTEEELVRRPPGEPHLDPRKQLHQQPRSERMSGWPTAPSHAAFHGPAGEFVIRTEPHTEADPMALLIQFLVAFGVAAGRHTYWPIEASRHYPNEFAVLVGPSSKGRKGSAWDHVESILADIDPAFAHEGLVSGLSSGEALIAKVRDQIDTNDADAPKDKRRLVIEPEFAQVMKVLAREGNTLSPVVRNA